MFRFDLIIQFIIVVVCLIHSSLIVDQLVAFWNLYSYSVRFAFDTAKAFILNFRYKVISKLGYAFLPKLQTNAYMYISIAFAGKA